MVPSRLVKQEIAKSFGREITLQCGSVSIPWTALEYTAYTLANGQTDMEATMFDLTVRAGLQDTHSQLMPPSIGAIASTRFFRETHAKYAKVNLYNVMTAFRGSEASDARDMVFALVGMVNDRNDPVLVPNYRLQVEEVFLSVTFLMLKGYGLDIPYDASCVQQNYPNITSWVADWTFRPRTTSFYAPPVLCHYHAAGKTSPVLRSPEYSNPLILDGVFIDHVKSFTPPLRFYGTSHDLN